MEFFRAFIEIARQIAEGLQTGPGFAVACLLLGMAVVIWWLAGRNKESSLALSKAREENTALYERYIGRLEHQVEREKHFDRMSGNEWLQMLRTIRQGLPPPGDDEAVT